MLIGLVFWGSIWGLAGAILSVPLLGAQKIILTSTDYPLAKRLLYLTGLITQGVPGVPWDPFAPP